MSTAIDTRLVFAPDAVRPQPAAILARLGVPGAPGEAPAMSGSEPRHGPGRREAPAAGWGRHARNGVLVAEVLDRIDDLLVPRAVLRAIDVERFAAVFAGEGHNAPEAPLGTIFPRARAMALYAATVGGPVSVEIARLFSERDFARAAFLDAAASEATERAGIALADHYRAHLQACGAWRRGDRLLRYSPGYCGWHVSAQRALFAALEPLRIGVTLRESCLMEPLKSISGVIVVGPAAIHRFEPDFAFCAACRSAECRQRMRALEDDTEG